MTIEDKLNNFLKQLDVAAWYRGTSPFQDDAINALYSKLRDDYEQGTSFRVAKCLHDIGITPMLSAKQLSLIIKLSRGHDVALLYFLLEGYYKVDCKPKVTYTNNEQLLMTAISKLDLMMIIRELDQILPPGQPTKKVLRLRKKRAEQRQLTQMGATRRKKPKAVKHPYFQKQPRPVERVGPGKLGKPDVCATFPFWKAGEKPVYYVRNEQRWFAEYKLNPMLRIVKECVDTAVAKLFDGLEKRAEQEQKKRKLKIVRNKLKQASELDIQVKDEELDDLKSKDEPKSLCAYHMSIGGETQLKKDTLVVEARNRCLEVINVSMNERQLQRDRIVKQLNADLETYINKYKKLQHTTVRILHSECSVCQRLVPTAGLQGKRVRMLSDKADISHPYTQREIRVQRLSGGGLGSCVKDGRGVVNRVAKCRRRGDELQRVDEFSVSESVDHVCERLYENLKMSVKKPRKYPKIGCPILRAASPRMLKRSAQQHLTVTYPNKVKITKRRFFNAPTKQTPYSFNYKHIYSAGRPTDDRAVIEKTLLSALKEPDPEPELDQSFFECEDVDEQSDDASKFFSKPCEYTSSSASISNQSTNLRIEKLDYKANVIDAVKKCTQKILEYKRRVFEQEEQEEALKDRRMALAAGFANPMKKLKYKMDYFDPDDTTLMDRLLKDGMNSLREDPRFVLPSLPDSYKLRLLREWIARRYGKTYTQEDCTKQLEESISILKSIIYMATRGPLDPEKKGMPVGNANYDKHDKYMALGRKIRENYYKVLNERLMLQMNISWFAFSSYTGQYSRAKNSFFSYMPAHNRDVKRVHPWNPSDFRNFRQMRTYKPTPEAKT